MDENVVPFPKGKKNSPPQSLAEIRERNDAITIEHINAVIDAIMPYVCNIADEESFDFSSPECRSSVSLVVESLRAALYKARGLPHALHTLSDNINVNSITFAEVVKVEEISDEGK